MTDYELGEVQTRFANIIWDNSPVSSGRLVQICSDELGWKKSTTYTVLKKLCEKGLFENRDGIVTALVSREEYYSFKSEQFVESTFGGSLPSFIAAFTSKQKLSQKDISAIKEMISRYEKENGIDPEEH